MKSIVNVINISRWQVIMVVALLTVGFLAVSNFNVVSDVEAKTGEIFATPESFSHLAEMASPAVVNIRTVKTIKGGGRVFRHFKRGPSDEDDPMKDFFNRFFGENHKRDFKQRSLGSGFFIDKDGYIVTNNHVIENADKIEVILKDEKRFEAEIVGRDANTDLALIKIKPERNLSVLQFGNSDSLKVGQWVVAIGNPFGLDNTVTAGIVSAKGRVIGSGPYDDFIQTDASINPGNSGGPLLNMNGEVVGINTAIIASGQGIGFAIPVNLARGIIEQLKQKGAVTRGWLGVGIQSLSEELAAYYGIENGKGVLVTEVIPGDPADAAGIKPKDIILSVSGKKVETARDLTSVIAAIGVGETAEIMVLRNGKTKTFMAKIAKREDAKITAVNPRKEHQEELGLLVAELTSEMARRYNLKEEKGVIVAGVEPGSKAGESGVQMGDIIKEINHHGITTVEDFTQAINKIEDGESINMFIRRRNREFIVVKLIK